jgi:hypothetical protein
MRKAAAARALRRVTLREYLDEPRPPLAARIDLAKRLLTAFGRIHDRGRVHGRIDPRFIVLEGARSFRVEVRSEDDPPLSGMREVRARPAMIEPTARGDVYALGLLLRELFEGEELPDGIARVVTIMTDPNPVERYANAHVAMCALVRVTMDLSQR